MLAPYLQDLCDQDTRDKGPWRLLLSASLEAEHSPEQLREAREVFLLCLQRLQIFAPSELLNTLNLVVRARGRVRVTGVRAGVHVAYMPSHELGFIEPRAVHPHVPSTDRGFDRL